MCAFAPESGVSKRRAVSLNAGLTRCNKKLFFAFSAFGGAEANAATGAICVLEGEVTAEDEEDATIYTVVVNAEEQYSIWPSHKPTPRGWRSVGKEARKAECLAYINETWTDMRPLSLRRKMDTGSR